MRADENTRTVVDDKLYGKLIREIRFFEEILEEMEAAPMPLETMSDLVGGIQRDLADLYRSTVR